MATLLLKDRASENLSLRNMASNVFNAEEFQGKDRVLVDFTGIVSISRSFAHEYLVNKEKQSCVVVDVNVPPDIGRMFEIVKNSQEKPELVKATTPVELTWK